MKCYKPTKLQHLTAVRYCGCQLLADFIPMVSYFSCSILQQLNITVVLLQLIYTYAYLLYGSAYHLLYMDIKC